MYVPWFVCIYQLAQNVHAAGLPCAVFTFTVFVWSSAIIFNPCNSSSSTADTEPKLQRKMMSIGENVKLLVMLKEG